MEPPQKRWRGDSAAVPAYVHITDIRKSDRCNYFKMVMQTKARGNHVVMAYNMNLYETLKTAQMMNRPLMVKFSSCNGVDVINERSTVNAMALIRCRIRKKLPLVRPKTGDF